MTTRPYHHPTMGPSSWPALQACGHFLSGGKRVKDDDEDATTGDLMHDYVLSMLKHDNSAVVAAPEKLQFGQREKCITAHANVTKFLLENIPVGEIFDRANIESEVEVSIYDRNMATEISYGHADLRYLCIVIDLKAGLNYQTDIKKHKAQLAGYALGIMQKYKYDKVLIAAYWIMPERIESYWLTYEEAMAIAEHVLAQSRNKAAALQPNLWCRYCKRFLYCPKINELYSFFEGSHGSLRNWNGDPYTTDDPKIWADLLSWCKLAEQRIEKIRDIATQRVKNGEMKIPHWKLKEKAGRIVIGDIMKAFALSGLQSPEFLAACTLSVPKLAEIVAQKKGLKQKDARKEVESKLTPVITDPGKPSKYLEHDTKAIEL